MASQPGAHSERGLPRTRPRLVPILGACALTIGGMGLAANPAAANGPCGPLGTPSSGEASTSITCTYDDPTAVTHFPAPAGVPTVLAMLIGGTGGAGGGSASAPGGVGGTGSTVRETLKLPATGLDLYTGGAGGAASGCGPNSLGGAGGVSGGFATGGMGGATDRTGGCAGGGGGGGSFVMSAGASPRTEVPLATAAGGGGGGGGVVGVAGAASTTGGSNIRASGSGGSADDDGRGLSGGIRGSSGGAGGGADAVPGSQHVGGKGATGSATASAGGGGGGGLVGGGGGGPMSGGGGGATHLVSAQSVHPRSGPIHQTGRRAPGSHPQDAAAFRTATSAGLITITFTLPVAGNPMGAPDVAPSSRQASPDLGRESAVDPAGAVASRYAAA